MTFFFILIVRIKCPVLRLTVNAECSTGEEKNKRQTSLWCDNGYQNTKNNEIQKFASRKGKLIPKLQKKGKFNIYMYAFSANVGNVVLSLNL